MNEHNLLYIDIDKFNNNNIITVDNIDCNFIIPLNVDSGSFIEYNYDSYLTNINKLYVDKPINFNMLNVKLLTYNYDELIFDNNNSDILLIFEYE